MIIARAVFAVVVVTSLAAGSCGGSPPGPREVETTAIGALTSDGGVRSQTAWAVHYRGEIARLRDIARKERDLSAVYAKWTPPARATKNWNETLKARADARAVAADQAATRLGTFADFHTAEAAKEMGR